MKVNGLGLAFVGFTFVFYSLPPDLIGSQRLVYYSVLYASVFMLGYYLDFLLSRLLPK